MIKQFFLLAYQNKIFFLQFLVTTDSDPLTPLSSIFIRIIVALLPIKTLFPISVFNKRF